MRHPEIRTADPDLYLTLLTDPDMSVRLSGVYALQRFRQKNPSRAQEFWRAFEPLLADTSDDVRHHALCAMSDIDGPATVRHAVRLMGDDPNMYVRRTSVMIIAQNFHPGLSRYILARLDEEESIYVMPLLAQTAKRYCGITQEQIDDQYRKRGWTLAL